MSNIQYTIRNIPQPVDRVIRKRAKQSGQSFNQTVVELLNMQIFGTSKVEDNSNFDWLYNKKTLDRNFDKAIKDMSQIDDKLWK